MLSQNNSSLQSNAIFTLGEIGDPRAVAPLSEMLRYTPDWFLACSLMQALAALQDSSVLPLVLEKRPQNEFGLNVWFYTLEKLGWTPRPGDLLGLDYYIWKKDYSRCLGFGDFAIDPLLARFTSVDHEKIADALIELNDILVVPRLVDMLLLEPEFKSEGGMLLGSSCETVTWNNKCRLSAIRVIKALDRGSAIPALIGILAKPYKFANWYGFHQQFNKQIMDAAVDALSKYGAQPYDAIAALFHPIERYEHDQEVMEYQLKALFQTGDPRAFDLLVKLYQAKGFKNERAVHGGAIWGFEQYGDRRAVELLTPEASKPGFFQYNAKEAIKKLSAAAPE